MRPASVVVLPLPGPARMLSGPSPAVIAARCWGEKRARSTSPEGSVPRPRRAGLPRPQRWELLWRTITGSQLPPAQEEGRVQDVMRQAGRMVLWQHGQDQPEFRLRLG